MDKKITKKKFTVKRVVISVAVLVLLSFILYSFLFADKRSKLNVNLSTISLATVKEGSFQEFIPVTGNGVPGNSVFLDAVQNGTISQIFKESGAIVKKGDTLMVLSNPNLQLSTLGQESQLYEQLNHLRTTRLALDQNSLQQKEGLAEVDFQLQLLKPQYERLKHLFKEKLISQQEFEVVKEQYTYNLRRKEIRYDSFKQDSLARILQYQQLKRSEERMMQSLVAVEHILDDLIIKAPVDGQLSTPELQPGEAVSIGERLGQIDIIDKYKVRAEIDEFYISRISHGQRGVFTYSGKEFPLTISKIYPGITEGRFEVDMEFLDEALGDIKRGQSFHIRLELGNSASALLLPSGSFYADTGGNWVFVLDESGEKATKRNIKIGRRNPDFFEVVEGLSAGEKVITSSYKTFGDNDVIILK